MNRDQDRYPADKLATAKILWVAFVVSHVIFAGIAWFLVGQRQPDWQGDPLVLYILVGMGVLAPVLAPLVGRMTARKGSDEAQGVDTVLTGLIVGFAMRESGAMFAFVILFLSGDSLLWAVPAALAFASILVAFPSVAALDRLRGDGSMRRPLV